MKKIKVRNFSLKHTLECGQIFRWQKSGNHYIVVSRDKIMKLRQDGNYLFFEGSRGADERFVEHYFRLDDNYSKILKSISRDNQIKKIIAGSKGLRIIRQDPWECLISYICSSASNIPKIRKNLDLLSRHFGREISFDGKKHFAFPEPGAINSIKKIRNCSVGFRAKYILNANNSFSEIGSLKNLGNLNYFDAKDKLTALKGVGHKIADCVLLFSMEKLEAFPTDVWIKRVVQETYFNNENLPEKKIADFGRAYFGEYAGYAQEFLYEYGRKYWRKN